ncbi:protein DA1-related 1-like isoform X2 [Vigna radiata var. radiata]|uniref:Protein DA1-related 1-like isoform X2 n=1 Tax=Vigna radiata var. radiata TaxID=3916 RepID=A0A3Q0FFC3_VIGRR|nr:protein DA1-related 1-like isoform X2 [Vigna radiata var. radiata]
MDENRWKGFTQNNVRIRKKVGEIEKEEIDRAIALSLSKADPKGKKVIEDDSEFEDDELCPLDDEEEKRIGEVQQDEDDHHAQIQDEDQNLNEFPLEEDEQLARAIQESLSISSPPRSDTDSLFQTFANLFPPVYRKPGSKWVDIIKCCKLGKFCL